MPTDENDVGPAIPTEPEADTPEAPVDPMDPIVEALVNALFEHGRDVTHLAFCMRSKQLDPKEAWSVGGPKVEDEVGLLIPYLVSKMWELKDLKKLQMALNVFLGLLARDIPATQPMLRMYAEVVYKKQRKMVLPGDKDFKIVGGGK